MSASAASTNKEDREDIGARPGYHHGDLRQCLIDAACQFLRRESADRLSLRALAREAGVSQTAPYRHFDSKNALFAAIATQGFELMADHIRKAEKPCGKDTRLAVVEIGVAYVQWATQNPEKYQLFFDSSLLDFRSYHALQEAGDNCFQVLLDRVRQGREEGIFADMPAEQLAGILWASVHGLASLIQKQMVQNFEGREETPVVAALKLISLNQRQAIELFVNSIKSVR